MARRRSTKSDILHPSALAVQAGAAGPGAAAAHLPAPWFPRLVHKIETRKNETAHNLMRGQEKVSSTVLWYYLENERWLYLCPYFILMFFKVDKTQEEVW